MLDIKFLRNNPDIVKQNIKNKFQDEKLPLVDEVIGLTRETARSNRKWRRSAQRKIKLQTDRSHDGAEEIRGSRGAEKESGRKRRQDR